MRTVNSVRNIKLNEVLSNIHVHTKQPTKLLKVVVCTNTAPSKSCLDVKLEIAYITLLVHYGVIINISNCTKSLKRVERDSVHHVSYDYFFAKRRDRLRPWYIVVVMLPGSI